MALPVWEPSAERVERANLNRFIRFARTETGNVDLIGHHSLYHWSTSDPDRFWTLVWDFCGIRAQGERAPVLVDADRIEAARWFPNVRLNFAQNLLRYNDEKPAIVFRSEGGAAREISYSELNAEVAQMAAALAAAGVGVGDRVAGLLPNIPEAAIAMLATAALGATWASCSPDLGADAVTTRFGQLEPKVLVGVARYAFGGRSIDCMAKLADIATRIESLARVVVVPYLDPDPTVGHVRTGTTWNAFVSEHVGARPAFTAVPFDQPLYVLFAPTPSGTCAGIVHGVGGTLIQHLKELVLHIDVRREDRIFYFTTSGFLMWNWLMSALAVGATVVLYDGSPSYPHAGVLFDLADECEVSVFGTTARWLHSVERAGLRPIATHKLLELRSVLVAGPLPAPANYDYVYRDIKPRVLLATLAISPDTLSCAALGSPLLPVYRGEIQCRGLGLRVETVDDGGDSVRDEPGALVYTAPFPSMAIGLWGDRDGRRRHAAWFQRIPGAWGTGERAMLTANDGVVPLARG